MSIEIVYKPKILLRFGFSVFESNNSRLSASTINCGLRTLRRALKLAVEWGKLEKEPKIALANGEKQRERVVTEDEVRAYVDASKQP